MPWNLYEAFIGVPVNVVSASVAIEAPTLVDQPLYDLCCVRLHPFSVVFMCIYMHFSKRNIKEKCAYICTIFLYNPEKMKA